MDYTITWGGDPEDVCLATRGKITLRELHAMISEAVSDPRWVNGMRVLLDHTQADASVLTSEEIEERAATVVEIAEAIGSQRVALAFADEGSLTVWRLEALLLDWQVGFEGRGFTSLTEAREWLRRPPGHNHAHVIPRP